MRKYDWCQFAIEKTVYENLNDTEKEQFDRLYAFPDSAVDRIVPNQNNEDKLMVIVEPYHEWVVDETGLIGGRLPIDGITYVNDLKPYIERKLFTVNTGHALTAYFAYYYGYETIHEALEDHRIKELVRGGLQETGTYLVKKYGFNQDEHEMYIQTILNRFANKFITDEVTRVARNPIRKIGPNDRFVNPAKQYYQLTGQLPHYLLKGIAAALIYDYNNDEQAMEIQRYIREHGVEDAIGKYTGIERDTPIFNEILKAYGQLKNEVKVNV